MMKKFIISLFILLGLIGFSESVVLLENQVNYVNELNKAYSKAIQNLIDQNTLLKTGSDYFYDALYSKDPLLGRLNNETNKAIQKINEARSKGASREELARLSLDYQNTKLMESKQLVALVETNLYGSIEYTITEGLKGSLETASKIIDDVISKWKTILEPLLEGDFGGVIKNAILQFIDSTYKVTFIDYCKSSYGATEKIANRWWKNYFVDPFQNTEEKKLLDKMLTEGSNELKEKLKDKLSERIKLEILNQSNNLTSEALEKTVKEKAEAVLKNLIETPSLMVELFVKYYNVADFQFMFNDLAPNEIAFIKQIREIVGNNENEINRCYFDKSYFLTKRKQAQEKKLQKIEAKENTPGIIDFDNDALPVQIVENIIKVANKEDPAVEINNVVLIDMHIEENNSHLIEKTIPLTDKSIKLVDSIFEKLKNDEISLSSFKAETQGVINSYNSIVAKARDNIIEDVKKDYQKRIITLEEYSERKTEAEELAEEYIAELSNHNSELGKEIKDAQNDFEIEFRSITDSTDIKGELLEINNILCVKIDDFKSLYSKTGNNVPHYSFYGFSQLISAFSDEENGFGETFFKSIFSNSPSVFLLEHGKSIMDNLLAIYYFEKQSIQNLSDDSNKLWEELSELFDSVPGYYYTNMYNENLFTESLSSIESSRNTVMNRLGSLSEWEESLYDWIYFAELKNEKTQIYLSSYLVLSREKIKIFDSFIQILQNGFSSLEKDYIIGWENRIESIFRILEDMVNGEITTEKAEIELNSLSTLTNTVDFLYEEWKYLRKEITELSNEIRDIKERGVPLLNLNYAQINSNYLKTLIGENELIKADASKAYKEYEDASLYDLRHDLEKKIRDFGIKIVDHEVYPDDYIRNESTYNIRNIIREAFYQKGGMAFHIDFSNPDTINAAYGDIESAVSICEKFRVFLEQSEQREITMNEVNKVLESSLNDIEAKLNEIENRGSYEATEEEKEELLTLLDESIEKAIDVFEIYGFDIEMWHSSREKELRKRVEELQVRKMKITDNTFKTNENFTMIEKPAKISQDEIVWLDVMNAGYPGHRFALSPDQEKLLIELQTSIEAGKRFRLYNLVKQGFEQFTPPPEATDLISDNQYNFSWTEDNEIYIYSYDGEGVVISSKRFIRSRAITTMTGVSLYDLSSSGNFVLAREMYGKIFVINTSNGSYKNIGTTYFNKTLQWIPGTDQVFFVNENNMINVYDAKKDLLEKHKTVFSGYTCALLPGGEWFIHGQAFELKATKLDGTENVTLLKLDETSQILIDGVYPLYGNTVLVLWMKHGDQFDYGIQVCDIE